MSNKLLLIGALCICAIAILAIDAYAAPNCPDGKYWDCKYVPRKVCTCWAIGSSQAGVTYNTGLLPDCDPDTGAGCITAVGEISGTIEDKKGWCGDGWDGDPKDNKKLDDGSFDPDCLVDVTLFCLPKKCRGDWTKPGCIDVDSSSVHIRGADIPLEEDLLDCIKSGNCKGLLEFFKEADYCPKGLDAGAVFATCFQGRVCVSDPDEQDGIPMCNEGFYKVDPTTVEPGDGYQIYELLDQGDLGKYECSELPLP